mmetsp:Transcript_31907/g.85348  ORF Transcript_31907/g.85348 Transcript_31907/m.85348 type:complete len:378 (-) Transcript_31907:928-2061(-)
MLRISPQLCCSLNLLPKKIGLGPRRHLGRLARGDVVFDRLRLATETRGPVPHRLGTVLRRTTHLQVPGTNRLVATEGPQSAPDIMGKDRQRRDVRCVRVQSLQARPLHGVPHPDSFVRSCTEDDAVFPEEATDGSRVADQLRLERGILTPRVDAHHACAVTAPYRVLRSFDVVVIIEECIGSRDMGQREDAICVVDHAYRLGFRGVPHSDFVVVASRQDVLVAETQATNLILVFPDDPSCEVVRHLIPLKNREIIRRRIDVPIHGSQCVDASRVVYALKLLVKGRWTVDPHASRRRTDPHGPLLHLQNAPNVVLGQFLLGQHGTDRRGVGVTHSQCAAPFSTPGRDLATRGHRGHTTEISVEAWTLHHKLSSSSAQH